MQKFSARARISGAALLALCFDASGCSKTDMPSHASPDHPAPAAGSGAAGSESKAGASGMADSGRIAPDAGGTPAGGKAAPTGGMPAADGGARAPAAGSGGSASQAPAAGDLIVSPDGSDTASGSMSEPTSLSAAIKRIAPGHAIYLRGGTYAFNAQLTIERDNSGSDGQLKTLAAVSGEAPILDFSGESYGKDSNPRGLQLNGSYWHIRGLTVRKAADNGIYVAGSHNVIEDCVIHANRDTGLQLGRYSSSAAREDWPSDNLILNCESYDNYDAPPGAGENADGFAAKLTVGDGNVFRGCVSHNNIDDGWDLYTKTDTGAIGAVTIDQCVAHDNGKLTDGTTNKNGDRNGFKLGGEKIAVPHVVTRSIAYANGHNGFTWNSNPGAIRLSNTLAFDNAEGNYRFGDSDTPTQAVFTNNVSLWTKSDAQSDKALGNDASGSNCFYSSSGMGGSTSKKGLTCKPADFAHDLGMTVLARNADGSPDLSAFALANGSALINAGVMPAGMLPFPASDYKDAPDLGAVEQAQ